MKEEISEFKSKHSGEEDNEQTVQGKEEKELLAKINNNKE